MKRLILKMLVLMFFSSGIFAGEKFPEFDGGYILTSDGKLIEVPELKYNEQYWSTVLIDKRKNRAYSPSTLVKMAKNPWYYCMDISNIPEIKQSKFKGFYLKGRYKFNLFGFALLNKIDLNKMKMGLFENHGPAKNENIIYVTKWPEYKVDWRAKTISDNLSYYEPKKKFKKGLYVAWPGVFFVFRII